MLLISVMTVSVCNKLQSLAWLSLCKTIVPCMTVSVRNYRPLHGGSLWDGWQATDTGRQWKRGVLRSKCLMLEDCLKKGVIALLLQTALFGGECCTLFYHCRRENQMSRKRWFVFFFWSVDQWWIVLLKQTRKQKEKKCRNTGFTNRSVRERREMKWVRERREMKWTLKLLLKMNKVK
jgi:hypothetical protein